MGPPGRPQSSLCFLRHGATAACGSDTSVCHPLVTQQIELSFE
jgi:hypothetical protein